MSILAELCHDMCFYKAFAPTADILREPRSIWPSGYDIHKACRSYRTGDSYVALTRLQNNHYMALVAEIRRGGTHLCAVPRDCRNMINEYLKTRKIYQSAYYTVHESKFLGVRHTFTVPDFTRHGDDLYASWYSYGACQRDSGPCFVVHKPNFTTLKFSYDPSAEYKDCEVVREDGCYTIRCDASLPGSVERIVKEIIQLCNAINT